MIRWGSPPSDTVRAGPHQKRPAARSLAGPVAHCTIAISAGRAMRIGLSSGLLQSSEGLLSGSGEGILQLLHIAFSLNILLGTFNLLPLPPLDGFTAIGILLPESAACKLEELR